MLRSDVKPSRRCSVTVGGISHTYAYAGDGRRLSATSGGIATQFVWDMAFSLPMLMAERDGSGVTLRSYAYGLALLSQSAAGASTYYHHDGLGSVVDLSDASGASLGWAEFAPFGDPATKRQPPARPATRSASLANTATRAGSTTFAPAGPTKL